MHLHAATPKADPQLLWSLCHDCRKKHPVELDPGRPLGNGLSDWWEKHKGHRVEFRLGGRRRVRRQRPWLRYDDNTNYNTGYAASAALTFTLASLASSSTLVAGRESTAVDNTTPKYLDYLLGGYISVGTTPTVNTSIEVWAHGSLDDTPTYADVLTGADAAATISSAGIKNNGLVLIQTLNVDTTTSNRKYPFYPVSVAALFGNMVPKKWGVFVTHNTVAALNATGGNHVLSYTGGQGVS